MVRKTAEPLHLLFETSVVKWTWAESELIRFREMWQDGASIGSIAKKFNTNMRSVVLLIIDQADADEIKPRKSGIFGY